MYTIILFTVALVLVLLSFAATDYKKANENYESRVQSLQNENLELKELKAQNDTTIAGLNTKVESLTAERDKYKNAEEAYANAVESIYIADGYCEYGEYKKAYEELEKVDSTILKEKILGRYKSVKAKIDARYTPEEE
ncbi:MAG: hypothetical protein IJN25_09160 [Clostridia bacterium]|nr:hypothetical protein [Clostridia bacterium]